MVGLLVGVLVGAPGVTTSVLVGVLVIVAVGTVGVVVGVLVGQVLVVNVSCSPALNDKVLHENCLKLPVPTPFCTPTVAPLPPAAMLPYTMSIRFCPSYRRASKFT